MFLEAIILGLLNGSVYALMASGLALTYGVMNLVNVAQGILVVLAAYLSYTLEQWWHIDLFLSLLITMPLLFVLGVVIDLCFLRRMRDTTLSLLAMFAIALCLEGGLTLLFGSDYVQLHAWYVEASIPFLSFYLPDIYLLAFLLSVMLLAMLWGLLYATKFGAGLRASVQNRTAAQLIGIDVQQVATITFGIGVALAAAGGAVFGAINAFNPASSYDLISRLLVIIVLGGMGSLRGALIGSFIMLVIGDVTAVMWSPLWESTVFFGFLIILLLIRPHGLFAKPGRKQ
jgi:branched-chain amino acid transport system permease protein